MGKPGVAGAHTTQRLNLSKPWEGSRMIGQCLEPDPGNLAVRDFRGASGNVRQGETVTPSCNRKSGNGNPSPTARRARFLSRPLVTSAFPKASWATISAQRLLSGMTLRGCSHSLIFRPPSLPPPGSFPPPASNTREAGGGHGAYVRAERGPRASDMLAVRMGN